MLYLVGIFFGLAVALCATYVGFDKDRAFYPTVMAVIASYYGLFAVMGGSIKVLLVELGVITFFLVLTVLGFKRNLWFIVGALFFHGMFDLLHNQIIVNSGVPIWWPNFCLAYDLTAAIYLSYLLASKSSVK